MAEIELVETMGLGAFVTTQKYSQGMAFSGSRLMTRQYEKF